MEQGNQERTGEPMRKLAVLLAVAGTFFAVSVAQAAPPTSIFNSQVACGQVTTQGNVSTSLDQTWCGTIRPWATNVNGGSDSTKGDNISAQTTPMLTDLRSTVQSFDGVPIDVNVAFPDEGVHGPAPYPLVMMFHGYGGQRLSFNSMQRWLDDGYAVLTQTNRGFHQSCGSVGSKAADPDCLTKGFVRLDDTRYEVRDAQLFAGMLVDEGLVSPGRIAATGGSYGGGMSMALAALKNRIMDTDGTYKPWVSPVNETPISLAVATPNIPWTDLAYSLVPNGSNIDYIKDASYYGRFGVMKQSYVNGLYLSGLGAPGYYTPPGEQPQADLAGWKAFMDAGEPYDATAPATQMLDEITKHHSSYYIDHSQAPAPLLISSGFTDDLFPANEATRYYNRTRAQFPNAPLSLFFGSFGHMRGQNGSEVSGALNALEKQWIDYYLKDIGSKPASNVTTWTQVCPDGATDAGPFTTGDWVSQSPGEIRVLDKSAAQTVAADGGDRANGALFNPAPSGTACAAGTGALEPGTANYETQPAPAGGYTVMGSPTVIAKITQEGSSSQLSARLVDVSADGATKTLVNRGIWRPTGSGFQVFQLYPNGWHVDAGHKLRLELLPFDGGNIDPTLGLLSNFSRPSNNQRPATIEYMDLRIPVREAPGALDGLVTAPAKRVLPDRPGVELAVGNESIGSESMAAYVSANYPCPTGTTGPGGGNCTPNTTPEPPVTGDLALAGKLTVKGKHLTVKLTCRIGNDTCRRANLVIKGAPKKGKKGKGILIVKKSGLAANPGQTKTFRIKLTSKARKFFRDRALRKRGKVRTVRGPKSLRSKVTINGKSAGFKAVKRVGKVK